MGRERRGEREEGAEKSDPSKERTVVEQEREGLGGDDPNAHTHMCTHIYTCTYTVKCKREKEGEKSEGEATTKTPGEHPSPSGASSEKFLPFSPQDYGNPWEPRL